MRRARLAPVVLASLAWFLPAGARAQPPTVHYVYDALDRLIAVIDAQGNAAAYTYDAVGNLLRIDRVDALPGPDGVAITLVAPGRGKVGATVEVFGRGFAAGPADNALAFGGAPATVTAATPNRLATAVPPGATTGPITVTTVHGTATSPAAFQVISAGPLSVTPSRAVVSVTRSLQLQALEGGVPAPGVRWSVNGIPGGAPTLGTVSATGLYTAPPSVPAPPTVAVSAAHADDPTVVASASLTVLPPEPLFLAASQVSVAMAATPPVVDRSVLASVSVRVAEPTGAFVASAPVSVAIAPGAPVNLDILE